MNQIKVTKAIEEICAHGCIRVNEVIIELEKGQELQHTQDLSDEETASVLAELKSIMAVYDKDEN
ncbi:MAG: hypothetical protein ACN4GM_15535 [Gammaproteobacteria bacterium]